LRQATATPPPPSSPPQAGSTSQRLCRVTDFLTKKIGAVVCSLARGTPFQNSCVVKVFSPPRLPVVRPLGRTALLHAFPGNPWDRASVKFTTLGSPDSGLPPTLLAPFPAVRGPTKRQGGFFHLLAQCLHTPPSSWSILVPILSWETFNLRILGSAAPGDCDCALFARVSCLFLPRLTSCPRFWASCLLGHSPWLHTPLAPAKPLRAVAFSFQPDSHPLCQPGFSNLWSETQCLGAVPSSLSTVLGMFPVPTRFRHVGPTVRSVRPPHQTVQPTKNLCRAPSLPPPREVVRYGIPQPPAQPFEPFFPPAPVACWEPLVPLRCDPPERFRISFPFTSPPVGLKGLLPTPLPTFFVTCPKLLHVYFC